MAGAGKIFREKTDHIIIRCDKCFTSGQPWYMPGVWPLGHIGATIFKDKAGFRIVIWFYKRILLNEYDSKIILRMINLQIHQRNQ